MNKRFDIAIIALLTLIVGVFFYRTIVSGLLPVPTDALVGLYHPWRDHYAATNPRGVPFKNFLITDPVRQQIPWRKLAIDTWKEGKVPWWNPYSFSGSPLAANIQAAAFYPLNILFFVFSFPIAWTILIVLQPLLAMLFFYLYGRSLSLHPVAVMIGALSWGLGGFSIAWLTWGTIGHVALWLPLLLYAIEKKKSVVFALALASQFLAGHAQISLYVFGITLVYSLMRRRVLWIPLIAGFALAAIQWIPLLQMTALSGRIGESLAWQKQGWFLPWQHLVQFLIPDFFGNPATLNYWGEWNYGEFVGYIGIVGIFFASLSLGSALPLAGFFQVLLLAALLFMLPTPLAKLPFMFHIPLVSVLQPTRLMIVVSFSLSMLAAFGAHRWIEEKKLFVWRYISVFAAIFLAFWVSYFILPISWDAINRTLTIRNSILPTFTLVATLSAIAVCYLFQTKKLVRWGMTMILVGLAVFDLVRFGWKFTPFTPEAYFFPKTTAIAFLEKQPKPFRILSLDDRILPPNTSAYFGIENAEGYDPVFSRRYQEFMGTLQTGDPKTGASYDFNRIVVVKNVKSPLFAVLAPDYVLSIDELTGSEFEKVFEEGATKVYRYAKLLPRVYFAERIWRVQSHAVLATLVRSAFVPGKAAVVEENISVSLLPLDPYESITMGSYENGEMTFEASVVDTRLIVISQAYSPLVKATIDGRPVAVYPTNYIYSGVVVPQGSHIVKVSYSL